MKLRAPILPRFLLVLRFSGVIVEPGEEEGACAEDGEPGAIHGAPTIAVIKSARLLLPGLVVLTTSSVASLTAPSPCLSYAWQLNYFEIWLSGHF
jgi:hypothetical protein